MSFCKLGTQDVATGKDMFHSLLKTLHLIGGEASLKWNSEVVCIKERYSHSSCNTDFSFLSVGEGKHFCKHFISAQINHLSAEWPISLHLFSSTLQWLPHWTVPWRQTLLSDIAWRKKFSSRLQNISASHEMYQLGTKEVPLHTASAQSGCYTFSWIVCRQKKNWVCNLSWL